MAMFMVFLSGWLFFLLLLIQATRPTHASHSIFELRRRSQLRDKKADAQLRREEILLELSALRTPMTGLILVLLTLLLLNLFGWVNGGLAATILALLYGRVSQLALVGKLANKLYKKHEIAVLGVASRYENILRLFGGKKVLRSNPPSVSSREELDRMLEISSLFSDEDRRLLERTLRFKDRTVKELMIPRDKVVTVSDTELLGPLVLDDLHKTGHTIFPVVKGDAVVGLLDSSDHVDLHMKESVHVRSVMHIDVAKVSETASLHEALRALLRTKEQLLIVEGDDKQMTGIVGLKDIVRAIVGWE